jgi:superfamily I DNA/RNA helicase
VTVRAEQQCSARAVAARSRRRRIPYSWIGGSYRFTEEHIAEIIRLFQVEPIQSTDRQAARPDVPLAPRPIGTGVVTPLRARTPRRVRAAESLGRIAA